MFADISQTFEGNIALYFALSEQLLVYHNIALGAALRQQTGRSLVNQSVVGKLIHTAIHKDCNLLDPGLPALRTDFASFSTILRPDVAVADRPGSSS